MQRATFVWLLLCLLTLSSCKKGDNSGNCSEKISQLFSKDTSNSDFKISLKDYQEEAESIQDEAEQIIKKAASSNCSEAKKFAILALTYNIKIKSSTDLNGAERYVTQANDALSQSLSALSSCNDNKSLADSGEDNLSLKK